MEKNHILDSIYIRKERYIMKIRLVNDELEIIEYEILFYEKQTTTKENQIEYYSHNEIKYYIKLEDSRNRIFIRKFLFDSDEVHADIIFNSEKIYRLYNPNFNFKIDNEMMGVSSKYDFTISIITTLQ